MLIYVLMYVMAGQLSVCGENLNIAIFSDTIKVMNVKLCMMVVLAEHHTIHTTFSDIDCISRSQQWKTVLTENFMFLSDHVETLYYIR